MFSRQTNTLKKFWAIVCLSEKLNSLCAVENNQLWLVS